ncbi:MAG: preprotein translocase subunit SecA [Patescibacteria group bacterium]
MSFLYKIFGNPHVRGLKGVVPIVEKINGFEADFSLLSREALRAKTDEFKERLKNGASLDDILPEAFAVVREAGKRTMNMRHFDVQLIGGIVLHRGGIAEMRTGEGKTLVATLPAYLNALLDRGVHVVTVNDYLAKRDAVWMGRIYDYLGLTVGIIQNLRVSFVYDANVTSAVGLQTTADDPKSEVRSPKSESEIESFKVEDEFLRPSSRQEAYRCDITYGTNNEFGFDYLRDNMVQNITEMVMRPGSEMQYAIVDEVDSILIDEARTPLIISAPAEEAADQYYQFANLVTQLRENDDYNVDEKLRAATLTDAGIKKFEQWLGVENIYVEGGLRTIHHIEQALRAEVLYKKDRDYIVDDDEIIIIDEFTGRKMYGRRYSEGLHQAIEAKEHVSIQRESRTLATITFQNLFRMYKKLSGMTGTASTEAEEFAKIYNLDVTEIPTNKSDRRTDHPDRIYRTEAGKFQAIAETVRERQKNGQPVLIGTISVEKNERLSAFLSEHGVVHEILNAKNHEREGEIIAQAGKSGAVTLATNMAGRGVDIKLGGNPTDDEDAGKVVAAGGLFVLGTERHEARRIDNQLRGRSARQGDPGETQFYVSTDDDLMRIFGGDRLKSVMSRLKVPDTMPIEQGLITKILEAAQKKVEGHNFDIRKHVLQYDDVLNRHRDTMYRKRREILDAGIQEEEERKTKEIVMSMITSEIEVVAAFHTNPAGDSGELPHEEAEKENAGFIEGWNMGEIYETVRTIFSCDERDKKALFDIARSRRGNAVGDAEARERIVSFLIAKARFHYDAMEKTIVGSPLPGETDGKRLMREIEKSVLLRAIDMLWVEHLEAFDYLRTSIGLRGYGKRDPLVEYKKETYQMFNQLLAAIQKEVVYSFFKVDAALAVAPTIMSGDKLTLSGAQKESGGVERESKPRDEAGEKIGRNDPCYCGSGKKFKRCHGG